MKQVAIITLYGNNNFGNKLQNYAVQESLKKFNTNPTTLRLFSGGGSFMDYFINRAKYLLKRTIMQKKLYRNKNFKIFEKEYINNSQKIYFNNEKANMKYDYYSIGSDQVWNPYFGLKEPFMLAEFTNNKFSFSASFGVDKIDENFKKQLLKEIHNFKCISVREEQAKKIIREIDNNVDVEVLLDPTMLLTKNEWEKISKKPTNHKKDKYILLYFLGNICQSRKNEIERIAKEKDLKIINILDKNSEYYKCGPSEFLYLEENAELICTDSFHSCVFAILFDRPFIIFDREDAHVKMNSRLETLISKFNLKNRKYNGEKITEENLNHDYSEAYKILEVEREKSKKFLEKALDIEDNK